MQNEDHALREALEAVLPFLPIGFAGTGAPNSADGKNLALHAAKQKAATALERHRAALSATPTPTTGALDKSITDYLAATSTPPIPFTPTAEISDGTLIDTGNGIVTWGEIKNQKATPTPAPIDNEALVAKTIEDACFIGPETALAVARAVLALPSIAWKDELINHWFDEHETSEGRVADLTYLVEEAIGALEKIQGIDSSIISPANRDRYVEMGVCAKIAAATLAKLKEGRA